MISSSSPSLSQPSSSSLRPPIASVMVLPYLNENAATELSGRDLLRRLNLAINDINFTIYSQFNDRDHQTLNCCITPWSSEGRIDILTIPQMGQWLSKEAISIITNPAHRERLRHRMERMKALNGRPYQFFVQPSRLLIRPNHPIRRYISLECAKVPNGAEIERIACLTIKAHAELAKQAICKRSKEVVEYINLHPDEFKSDPKKARLSAQFESIRAINEINRLMKQYPLVVTSKSKPHIPLLLSPSTCSAVAPTTTISSSPPSSSTSFLPYRSGPFISSSSHPMAPNLSMPSLSSVPFLQLSASPSLSSSSSGVPTSHTH